MGSNGTAWHIIDPAGMARRLLGVDARSVSMLSTRTLNVLSLPPMFTHRDSAVNVFRVLVDDYRLEKHGSQKVTGLSHICVE